LGTSRSLPHRGRSPKTALRGPQEAVSSARVTSIPPTREEHMLYR
jgi:hypothetical protein